MVLAQIFSPFSTNSLTFQHKSSHLKTAICTNLLTFQHKSSHLTHISALILSHNFDPKPFKRCLLNILNNNREPDGPLRVDAFLILKNKNREQTS
jgi:flagella basal body P-ring formation protein FlgA